MKNIYPYLKVVHSKANMRISYFFTITFSIYFSPTWSGIDFLCVSLEDLKNVKIAIFHFFMVILAKGIDQGKKRWVWHIYHKSIKIH